MSDINPIVNRVSQSGIITLDLSEWLDNHIIQTIDIKNQLFKGLVLKEKDFRSWVKTNDWESFSGSYTSLFCSTNAIVPTWAYMLITNALKGKSNKVFFGDLKSAQEQLILHLISEMDLSQYQDVRVVVKGCGAVNTSAYVAITERLVDVAKVLMFGEPCSTVPVYKKKKEV
jgi:hypothetical protein